MSQTADKQANSVVRFSFNGIPGKTITSPSNRATTNLKNTFN